MNKLEKIHELVKKMQDQCAILHFGIGIPDGEANIRKMVNEMEQHLKDIEDITTEDSKYICLSCYIQKYEFMGNYKFPTFIKLKNMICPVCLKEKGCRKDD